MGCGDELLAVPLVASLNVPATQTDANGIRKVPSRITVLRGVESALLRQLELWIDARIPE